MRRGNAKESWTAVIASAVLSGALFFVLTTLVDRYIDGDEFDWSALGPSIGLTIVWIGIGAAARQGWLSGPGDERANDE